MWRVSCGVCIKEKKILLVRSKHNKSMWQFPGGKPENNESDYACLIREIGEELPMFRVAHAVYFDTIYAHTPYAGDKRAFILFLISGDGAITPNREIMEARWMDKTESGSAELGTVTAYTIMICVRRKWL